MKPWMMAALAALALAGSPALAQPQAAGQESEAAYAKPLETWLAELANWMGPAQALVNRSTDLFMAVTDGADKVSDLDTGAKRAEARRWAGEWVPARRAELTALKLDVQAIPQAPPLPAELASDPATIAKVAHLGRLDEAIKSLALDSIVQAELLVTQIEKAANGDAEAGKALLGASFKGIVATIKSENEFLRISQGLADPTHPQDSLISSMTSSNLGIIVLFEFLGNAIQDADVDSAAYGARIRQHALAAAAAANDTRQRAESMAKALRAEPTLKGTILLSRLEPAILLYIESAAVELEVASNLQTLAGLVASKDLENPEFSRAAEALDPLAEKRLDIDKRRRALIAGDG